MTRFKLYEGDCKEVLKKIRDGVIDLIVTSPPYDDIRTYGGLSWDFEGIATELTRVLKPGGVIVWVVADQTKNGSESGTSFRQALYFMSLGLNLHDTMIWQKGTAPFQHANRYINSFEYMFVFSKGVPNTTNIIKDRKNKWAGVSVHGTERQTDGSLKSLSAIQTRKTVKEFGARLNAWEIHPNKNNKTGHPAVFPKQLAFDHIVTWSMEGDVVLDPFLGSGTTGVASISLSRHFVGIEVNPEYFAIAQSAINEAEATVSAEEEKVAQEEEP